MEVVLNAFNSCFAADSLVGLWAYIDPGTGSLVFQVVAASLIAAGLFVSGVRDHIVWLITAGWRSKAQPTADVLDNAAIDNETRKHPGTASAQPALTEHGRDKAA